LFANTLLATPDPSSAASTPSAASSTLGTSRRRLFGNGIEHYTDPKSVHPKLGEIASVQEQQFSLQQPLAAPEFVIPEAKLADSKFAHPYIFHSRPADADHEGMIIDVLSIGSHTRPEYVRHLFASNPFKPFKAPIAC